MKGSPQSPSTQSLATDLCNKLKTSEPFVGFNVRIAAGDPVAVDINLSEACTLRIHPEVRCDGSVSILSATLSLAYPNFMPLFDKAWGVVSRSERNSYFPLTCLLEELADGTSAGVYASAPDAPRLLMERVLEVVEPKIRQLMTIRSAKAELERGKVSPWFNRVAYENFLPVAILAEEGVRKACEFAGRILLESGEGDTPRGFAYRRFIGNLSAMGSLDSSQIPIRGE